MFCDFVIRALQYRKQRLLLAFSALAIAATLATVLFGIYGTVERRLRDEFRSYGANIAAVPVNGKTVPLAIAAAAEKLGADSRAVSDYLRPRGRASDSGRRIRSGEIRADDLVLAHAGQPGHRPGRMHRR